MILRKYIEKNDKLLWFYLKIRSCMFMCLFYPFIKIRQFFTKAVFDNSYSYLKQFKNIHNNKRCFIIATGPSLEKQDIIKLKNECTFGVNALCLLFDELQWTTNYFVISDEKAYEKLESKLPKQKDKSIFISCLKRKEINKEHIFVPKNTKNNYLNTNKYKRFSSDISLGCYDAHTVVFNTMQIAAYMGFQEIYLLGVDCNYDDNIHKRYSINHGIINPYYKSAGKQMIEDFKIAKKYTDKLGIKVYNATRGGMLEVFERVDLDEILCFEDNC